MRRICQIQTETRGYNCLGCVVWGGAIALGHLSLHAQEHHPRLLGASRARCRMAALTSGAHCSANLRLGTTLQMKNGSKRPSKHGPDLASWLYGRSEHGRPLPVVFALPSLCHFTVSSHRLRLLIFQSSLGTLLSSWLVGAIGLRQMSAVRMRHRSAVSDHDK